MARLSQVVVLLLILLGSALTFSISPHHVHNKDGHIPGLKPAHSQLRRNEVNTELDNAENPIPEDTYISDGSNVKFNQEEDNNQEEPEDNNQEVTEDSNQKDIDDKFQKVTEDKSKTMTLSVAGKAESAVRSNESIYAFSAELSSNMEVDQGSTIVFDNVLMNEGGLYFGTSGQFACSDDGVYVFMWSLMTYSGSARGLGALAFGGENVKSGPQTNYYSSSSNNNGNSQMLSVVQCRSSPITAVLVRSMYSSVPTLNAEHSSFTGFRLTPDASIAVAFTAELSEDVPLFPGGRIMFDNVVSNLGGHYDEMNGIFVCPDNSVYGFSVSTYYPKASDQWSVSRLVFDGTPLLRGPMTYKATTSTDSGSSSVTALIQCQQGKNVHVEAEQSYEFDYTEYGADLTSFSGFRLCSPCDDLVAFSAVLTENTTTNSVDIPFGHMLLMRGNAYSPLTGVFTCPDDALYMFQWSATSIYGLCYLDLYVNQVLMKRNYMTRQSSTTSYGTSGTASQSVMIRCSAGDAVSLRGDNLSSTRILLAWYTTFSGYRLPGQ